MACIGLLSKLFLFLLAIDMYSETMRYNIITWSVKSLLMPVLLILFLLNAQYCLILERKFLVIALVFSWFGDLLLMQNRNDLFSFGLFSFLIAHLSYIISFMARLQHERHALKHLLTVKTMIIASVPFLAYATFMLCILCPKMNTDREETKGLLIPVVLYIFVIIGMAYTSYLRARKAPGSWISFVGAVCFVLSDTMLALNRFLFPLPAAASCIMLTYGIAQYLITVGTLKASGKALKAT